MKEKLLNLQMRVSKDKEINIGDELYPKVTKEMIAFFEQEGDEYPIGFLRPNPEGENDRYPTYTFDEVVEGIEELGDERFVVQRVDDDNELTHVNLYYIAAKETLSALHAKKARIAGRKELKFKVRGTIIDHPGKMEVVNAFNKNGSASVKLLLSPLGNLKVIFKETQTGISDVTAGEIKFSEEAEKENLIKLLKEMELTGEVTSTNKIGYDISVFVEEDLYESAVKGVKITPISEAIQLAAERSGRDERVIQEIADYLMESKISKKITRMALENIVEYPESVQQYIPEKPETLYIEGDKQLLRQGLASVLLKDNVLMAGDASTGKNLMATTIAWVLQKPLRVSSLSFDTDKQDLFGGTELVVENGVNKTEFVPSFFIDMMSVGGMVLLDEINMSSPAVISGINNALETSNRFIDIDSGSKVRVKAKDGFVAMAAMNPDYAGTTPLNQATKDRFVILDFGANESIAPLLKANHESAGAPEEVYDMVDNVFKDIRSLVVEGQVAESALLSLRGFQTAIKHFNAGFATLEEALINNVANKGTDMDEVQTLKDCIQLHIV